jgi:hypothetical protein
MDLRAEPMALSVPAVEKSRYYSVLFTTAIRSTNIGCGRRQRSRDQIGFKTGDLNDTKTISAFRFARAAGESIEAFMVVEDNLGEES